MKKPNASFEGNVGFSHSVMTALYRDSISNPMISYHSNHEFL